LLPSLANAFPYWTAQFIENSTANFFDQTLAALSQIQDVAGGPDKIHFMVGEAGWPGDGGSDYGNAKAGTVNAQTYFNKAICPALQNGIDVFMFEAFDEPYKGIVQVPLPDNGTTVQISEMFWGVMDKDRKLKLNLTCPDP
jgi:glucan 1,3-beta-glucosidase